MDICISGKHTEPSMFQYDYVYMATTYIENAAVPHNGRWISNDATKSAPKCHVEPRLNL